MSIRPASLVATAAWRSTSAGTAVLSAGLILANLAAWLWAFALFADRPAILGTAFLAWVFGLRHAVDADHIAAIDNVVRKLMHGGGRPRTVGLYFSLGHSTVVVIATVLLATTAVHLGDGEVLKAIGTGSLVSDDAIANGHVLVVVGTDMPKPSGLHAVHGALQAASTSTGGGTGTSLPSDAINAADPGCVN